MYKYIPITEHPHILTETPKKYIGYWRRTDLHQCFPFCECYKYPIPSPTTQLNQNEICVRSLKILQLHGEVIHYFGWSTCRICHQHNECNEYIITYKDEKYAIPFGYFHYITDHNVKMDDMLVEIVEFYENI